MQAWGTWGLWHTHSILLAKKSKLFSKHKSTLQLALSLEGAYIHRFATNCILLVTHIGLNHVVQSMRNPQTLALNGINGELRFKWIGIFWKVWRKWYYIFFKFIVSLFSNVGTCYVCVGHKDKWWNWWRTYFKEHVFLYNKLRCLLWAPPMSERAMMQINCDVFKNVTMDIFWTFKEVSLYLTRHVLHMLEAHITWRCTMNVKTNYNLTTSHWWGLQRPNNC